MIEKRKITYLVVVVLLIVWFLVSHIFDIPSVFFPKPEEVLNAFIKLNTIGYGTGKITLLTHYLVSMGRLMMAFILSVVIAIPLGVLSGSIKTVSAILDPIIEFYRSLPPLAYYTFLILWLGITEKSKITLLLLAGFPPMYISCVSGIKHVNDNMIYTSKMLGASTIQTYLHVVIPAALPEVLTGIRTAIGVEYTTLISAEMVAAKAGIGWMVFDASNWMKSDVVFVGILLMGITGIIMNNVVLLIEKKYVYWRGK